MFCLLMRCVLLPLRAFRPWVLNQPGRILTAYAIYTPSDGSSNVYPQAEEQRCWNHRIVNLLTKLPKRVHKPALLILRQIPYAETREEAQRLKKVFQHWCRQRGLTLAAELIEQDWDRMVTFYLLSKEAVAASANHQSWI